MWQWPHFLFQQKQNPTNILLDSIGELSYFEKNLVKELFILHCTNRPLLGESYYTRSPFIFQCLLLLVCKITKIISIVCTCIIHLLTYVFRILWWMKIDACICDWGHIIICDIYNWIVYFLSSISISRLLTEFCSHLSLKSTYTDTVICRCTFFFSLKNIILEHAKSKTRALFLSQINTF